MYCVKYQQGTCPITAGLCALGVHIDCPNGAACAEKTTGKCRFGHPLGFPLLLVESYDPYGSKWQRIPSDYMTKEISRHFNEKTMTFDVTIKKSNIRIDLTAGTETSPFHTFHTHIRGKNNDGVCLFGGHTACEACIDVSPITRENSTSYSGDQEGEVERPPRAVPQWSVFQGGIWAPLDQEDAGAVEAAYKAKEKVLKHKDINFNFIELTAKKDEEQCHAHLQRVKRGKVKPFNLITSCPHCVASTSIAPKKGPDFTPANKLLNRKWTPVPIPALSATTEFVHMQWNVLFQEYVERGGKAQDCCPRQYLKWSHRLEAMKTYIAQYQPDVLTLQEVENPSSDRFKDFQNMLTGLGFEGIAKEKDKAGSSSDSCAVYWKSSVFQKDKDVMFEYRNLDDDGRSNEDLNVGIYVRLIHAATKNVLWVATTHLKAHKLAEESRERHMGLLLREMVKETKPSEGLIISGDMNTSPRWEMVKMVRESIIHGSGMKSVFQDHASLTFTDREITIYMPHTQDMLDYTFHNETIRPTAVLVVPGERDIVAQHGREVWTTDGMSFAQLPLPSFPSDHFPMCARFTF